MSARRDLRIPFFPGKFARSEERSKGDTECCFEVGGIKTCVEREQVDNGDEEVGGKWEAFTVWFVAVDSSTATNGKVDIWVIKDFGVEVMFDMVVTQCLDVVSYCPLRD